MPAVLSIAAAAARLGVHRATVYRLVREGSLAHTRVRNGLRVPVAAVDAYVAGRTSTAWAPVDGRGSAGRRRSA